MRRASRTACLALVVGACNERPATSAPGLEAALHDAASPGVESAASVPAPSAAASPPSPQAPQRDAGASAPRCAATAWSSYAHDAARTSASEGCAEGPLAVTWKLVRRGSCGYRARVGRILGVVAEEASIFASVDCGGAPGLMRITPAGEPLWTFSRADYSRGHWPALAEGAVVSADDGVFLVDRETGKFRFHDLDVWGEPVVRGDTILVDNTFQLDGYGPFLGSIDAATMKWRWRVNATNPGKEPSIARTGGMAYDDGVIVHAAAMGGHAVPSLSAHDATTGDRKWVAPETWPESAPSLADGRVHTVERWRGEKLDRLVARSLADGAVVWSRTIAWARGPAPVVAGKLVILHGADGVVAYDRATGESVWTSPTPRKAPFLAVATTLAAAMGSRTLVVTSGPRLVLLGLDDGVEQWSGIVVTGWSDTSPGGVMIERPIVVGRSIYVTSDGALLRLDAKRGVRGSEPHE
jgi:outer membrane protein assembly factor BamB